MSSLTTTYEQSLDWMYAIGGRVACVSRNTQSSDSGQVQQIDPAFHQAYRRFAQTHPTWVRRRFDDDFLRQTVVKRLKRHQAANALPSGIALALAWDGHFGLLAADAARTKQVAELTAVANHFLHLLSLQLSESGFAGFKDSQDSRGNHGSS